LSLLSSPPNCNVTSVLYPVEVTDVTPGSIQVSLNNDIDNFGNCCVNILGGVYREMPELADSPCLRGCIDCLSVNTGLLLSVHPGFAAAGWLVQPCLILFLVIQSVILFA